MKWFKFYGQDWMTDMRVIKMTPEDRLCYITLMSLASNEDDDGRIKNCSEEAVIRMTHLPDNPYDTDNPHNNAKGCLERYAALRCVTIDDNGDVTILSFKRRQDSNLDGAERQKNYRERLKIKTKSHNNSDRPLRNDSDARIDKNRIEKKRETESIPTSFPTEAGKPDKESFGEMKGVKLTAEEHAKIVALIGEEATASLIFELDTYMASRGKRYKSHYATLLNWAKRKHDDNARKSISRGRGLAQ